MLSVNSFFQTLFNAIAILVFMHLMGFVINVTPSQPLGLYRKVPETWVKGDLVTTCLPIEAARLAYERGYIGSSSRCDGYQPAIKQVLGVAGDVVAVGRNISINGTEIHNSDLAESDDAGRVLVADEGGRISEQHIYLMSNHAAHSFDSRYFGEVPDSLVISKVKPAWVF